MAREGSGRKADGGTRRSLEAPALVALRDAVRELDPGCCAHVSALAALLVAAWPYLHGASARDMTRQKLIGNLSKLQWSPPLLSFEVVRDDAPEGVQTWQVDVQDGTAWIPRSAKLELPSKVGARELANLVVAQILAEKDSRAIVRKPAGGIAIRPGEIPGLDIGFAESLPGRHRRFRAALEEAMAHAGFSRLGPYRFRRKADDSGASR